MNEEIITVIGDVINIQLLDNPITVTVDQEIVNITVQTQGTQGPPGPATNAVIVHTTIDYTVASVLEFIAGDSPTDINIFLQDATSMDGIQTYIKNVNDGIVNIVPFGSQSIDQYPSFSLRKFQAVLIVTIAGKNYLW